MGEKKHLVLTVNAASEIHEAVSRLTIIG
jgi:hypothetical protein